MSTTQNSISEMTGSRPIFSFLGDVLTLKPGPIQRFASFPTLRQGLLVILTVGLLVGAVQALFDITSLVRPARLDSTNWSIALDSSIGIAQNLTGTASPEAVQIIDQVQGAMERFLPYAQQISDVQSPLPAFFGRFFVWLGAWLSTPFALLARWLLISVAILFFARLLGGRGGLVPHLSAASLSVVPQLLLVFAFGAFLGSLLGLVAGIWGLAVQVRVVQGVQGLSRARAILAVIAPYLALLAAIVAALFALLLTIVFASN